jgi:hypothetical protein
MSWGPSVPSRREVLAIVGALAAPWPAWAQTSEPASADPALSDEVLRLLPNLVTRLAVQVWLNNQGPFLFVVDTGANRTTMADTVADRLALVRGPEVLVHGVTSAQAAPTVHIDRLRVVGMEHRAIDMPVFPRDQLGADGLLGLDVLADFRLTFDLTAQTLRMGPHTREIRTSERGSRIRHLSSLRTERRLGQLLFQQVRVDGQRATAFVDSGSQYTIGNLALLRAVDARRPGALRSRWSVPIIGVTGQRRLGELALIDSLTLGGAHLGPTAVVFADLHAFDYLGLSDNPALLLGADMMARIDQVTVDFARGRVEFGRVRR